MAGQKLHRAAALPQAGVLHRRKLIEAGCGEHAGRQHGAFGPQHHLRDQPFGLQHLLQARGAEGKQEPDGEVTGEQESRRGITAACSRVAAQHETVEKHERSSAGGHHGDHHHPPHRGNDRPVRRHPPRDAGLEVRKEAEGGHLDCRHAHAGPPPEIDPGEHHDCREPGRYDRPLAAQNGLYTDQAAARCRTGPLLFKCRSANWA